MLTQAQIDKPDENKIVIRHKKPITFNRPCQSVECLPGFAVALNAARRVEKEAKAKLLADQQPERKEAAEPRWVLILGPVAKWIGLTAAGVFTLLVLVQAAKGLVR